MVAPSAQTQPLPLIPGGPGDPPADPAERARRWLAVMVDMAVDPDAAALLPPVPARRPLRRQRRRLPPAAALLPAILAVQACLSLRLTWSNTAFTDEALYLWAGRLEWAHLLHGTSVPPFSTFFSGAPVIYPPLGALADAIGGLAGARILSLAFMLGATVLLYSTAARLHGQRAGLLGAALWCCLGPTLHLSAFATYDAMSLFLVALAAWCATARPGRDDATRWMLAGGAALALANAAAYSSAIFDPGVAALAVLTAAGGKAAVRRGGVVTLVTFTLTYGSLLLAGGWYMSGVRETVLARAPGTVPALTVLAQASQWTALLAVLAAAGAAAAMRWDRPRARILMLLAATAALVPLEQARIHTLTSLDKHADMGAWFAAVAAGYTLDAAIRACRKGALRRALAAAVVIAVACTAAAGFGQARTLFSWPGAAGYVDTLAPMIARSRGPVLAEDAVILEYYLPAGSQWQRWSDTFSILLPGGKATGYAGRVNTAGDAAEYERLIARRYFSLIVLNDSSDTPALDRALAAFLKADPGYAVAGSVPYGASRYPVWVRR